MRNDVITFKDLSIFPAGGNDGVAGLLDFTTTMAGKEHLYKHIKQPPDNYESLVQMQHAIRFWSMHPDKWPTVITNGTLVMLDKFFESADHVTTPPTGMIAGILGETIQKLFNKDEYFFTQFSLSHLSDFLKGCRELSEILQQDYVPTLLQHELKAIRSELDHRLTDDIIAVTKTTTFKDQAKLAYHARRDMKSRVYRLMNSYARLDAWQAMAKATTTHGWTFPELAPAMPLCFIAKGLIHPLLSHPKPYDISFDTEQNFLLLTGANMSGKTTFMRSIGVGALLAHLGMGVPASALRISFFKGIITNMHVEDDLLKGESYFLAEVKRMKQTAEKLLQPEPHLVLMDELFKGTNVHDAYECTRAVVEGLLNRHNHLKILSTHLYEVAKNFTPRKDLLFAYFVTKMTDDDNFYFEYELKEGISQDRIGYRILQKEGVLDMLRKNNT